MVTDINSLFRKARQISRRIYVRVGLVAVLSLLAVGLAPILSPFIPDDFASNIGAESVGQILDILASSMLGVTTFSLTIMVAGFTKATSQWTPRSQLILREDTVTHSVLANFVGAYLYSLLAIVLRAADMFDHRDIVVLFGVTLLVVSLVVLSLIRWIIHLEGIGSLPRTAAAIEQQAIDAVERVVALPCRGGHPLTDVSVQIPPDAHPVMAPKSGYLQQIFEDTLQGLAEEKDARIYVTTPVGAFVHKGEVLCFVGRSKGPLDESDTATLCEALPLGDARSFEQDPGFGLTVLSEIAVRALSPGVNDPGTAIDISHRLGRVLEPLCEPIDYDESSDRIWIRPLVPDALFWDAFDPVSRCAGSSPEVHLAVLGTLDHLSLARNTELAEAAKSCAERCRDRAREAMQSPHDQAYLAKYATKM